MATAYEYDAGSRLLGILHARGGGSPATLQHIQYTLDANGNRTRMTDLAGSTTLTTTYQYDPLQRLIQAEYPAIPGGPSASTVDYTLDSMGNRLDDRTSSFSYDAADRQEGLDYSYDANGNLLADGITNYSYDAANQLIQTVTSGITTTYDYDGWGNLIRETRAGLTTDFVLDERGALTYILGAIQSDGTEELYAYGPEGVSAQRTILDGTPQGVVYPLLDGQGSLRHLTDGSGALILSRHYDAWGNVRHTSGSASTRLGFTGQLQTGSLVYLRARWYNTILGTFTSRDSFPGISTRPQSLNRYLYTENNPTNWTDPSGHAVDENGDWTPCNLLPGRADSCSLQELGDWWGSDDGDKARILGVTVVEDLGMALASIPNIPYQLFTDPKGVIWGILYSPFQFGSDLLHGMACGDPKRLAHATTAYGLFILGSVASGPGKTPIKTASEAEIQIIGFRGVGFNSERYSAYGNAVKTRLESEHGLVKAGHVGISWDGGNTIYGFFPADDAMTLIDQAFANGQEWIRPDGAVSTVKNTLDFLGEGGGLLGQVRNDTWVFKLADELAEATNNRTMLKAKTIRISRNQLQSIQQEVLKDVQAGSGRTPPQWYNFPPKDGGSMPPGCNNSATWPRELGINLPELTGRLAWYIDQLTETFTSPW